MEQKIKLNIKDWAEEDRPREKLVLKGVSSLSDAELLAILIGSGNRNETAVELSQRILHTTANNLNTLGKLSISDLTKNFKGIGEAKAITIIAALELGKRRKLAEALIQPQINDSRDVYHIYQAILGDSPHEEVWALLVNRSNKIIKNIQVSKGGVAGSVVDVRMILKEAINVLASGIILCHNHPSGNVNPSSDDDTLTLKIKEAAKLIDMQLLDHVIVCDTNYYSYKDKSRL